MTTNKLNLSYHKSCTRGLTQSEKKDIASIMAMKNLELYFDDYLNSREPNNSLSIFSFGESLQLFLIFTGSLAAKTLFQELIKDFYAFAKRKLKSERKGSKFALIFDIYVEGEKFNAGFDFNSESTLEIGLFRILDLVVSDQPVESEFVRIEYPQADDFRKIMSIIATITLPITAFIVGLSIYKLTNFMELFHENNMLYLIWFCAGFLLLVVIEGGLLITFESTINYIRMKRYVSKYEKSAKKLIEEINASNAVHT